MNELEQEVARAAERAVAMSEDRGGAVLDYSEASLAVLEEILDEASEYALSAKQTKILVEDLGSYVLEVARRNHGGVYQWFERRDQPVLVVGEPAFHVALLAWDKVRGRLAGDTADDIPFHYQGFAERVRKAQPNDRVLLV